MNTASLLTIDLRNEPHIVLARRRARDIAGLLGFEGQDGVRIAATVSEIARNAWRHAGGGRVEFRLVREADTDVFEIVVRDEGPGIPNLGEILDGRHRSPAGMGTGLLSGRRLMHRFDVQTSAQGTVVRLGKIVPRRLSEPGHTLAARISESLVRLCAKDTRSELDEQNRELLKTFSELEKSQSELTQLNRELEETNRGVVALYAELDDRTQDIQKVLDLKSRFLSNITHEFRTPLNSIIGLSRILLDRLDGDLGPEQEKQVRLIHRAASDLTDLVNDLLDLAKGDAGKVEVTPATVSVNELFATLRGMLRPLVDHNPAVSLIFDTPHPPVTIVSDERKLSQILRNLVSNALKYTQSGEVLVGAHVEDARIVFSVKDTGIGIPAEHHEKIFEEFYQVRNPLQQKTRGTGLGLALTRRLVDLLGGTITMQSTVGAGSTFLVSLPLRLEGVGPPPASETQPETGPGLFVLFVDDRVDALFNYERALEHSQFKAILARDETEAIDILKRVSVSVIMTASEPPARAIASALHASCTPAPVLVVAGPKPPGRDYAGPADVFLPESPPPDQLLDCLKRLATAPALTVLVVDESDKARKDLRTLLESFHAAVLEAGTVRQAVALIRERRPALVFVEPGPHGIDLDPLLSAAPACGELIIHSSHTFSDRQRDRLARHAASLVRKGPADDSLYRSAILQALASARRRLLRT